MKFPAFGKRFRHPLAIVLCATILMAGAFWLYGLPDAQPAKEFTPEPYFPKLDLGVSLPVDAKFILLNQPEKSGDAAELELMFTSRLPNAELTVEYLLPTEMRALNGSTEWQGNLELNETQRLRQTVSIDTEAPVAIQAKITINSGDYSATRGVAYNFDLGEVSHASYQTVPVEGYQGGSELNLIIPKK